MKTRSTSSVAPLFVLLVFSQARIAAAQVNNGAISFWRHGISDAYFTSGIVEVHHGGLIGYVCHGGTWGMTEADTVCYQLGYSGASGFGVAGDGILYGIVDVEEGSTLLSQVSCTADAISIWQCSFVAGATGDDSCTNRNNVFVECYTQRLWDTAPYQGMVRLQEALDVISGRVEVYCNDRWGTVCAGGFDEADADTVCRQLGYQAALVYNYLDLPSSPDTPQWFSDFNCSQPQSCISYCNTCPAEAITPCITNEATVKCYFDEFTSLTVESCQMEDCEDCSSHMATILGSVAASVAILVLFVVVPLIIWCCVSCHPHTREQEEAKTKAASSTESTEIEVAARSASHKAVKADTELSSHIGITLAPPPYSSRSFYQEPPSNQVLTTSPPPPYDQSTVFH